MPGVNNGEDLSIYRSGKLYSFDGKNQWAVHGKHVNDNCIPRGTLGEPIFFNPDLTPTTYSYMGLNNTNCYGIVAKRAIKNIWRIDKADKKAPINLLLKLTTDATPCNSVDCNPSAQRPRGCKSLSKTLQQYFQKAMVLYILAEYCDVSEKKYVWKNNKGKVSPNVSLKDLLYYHINEKVGNKCRSDPHKKGCDITSYDEAVFIGIESFVDNVLKKQFSKAIQMKNAVQGYHCDTNRHGPAQRRHLFNIFEAYGDDNFRRSFHYDDRVCSSE